MKNTRSASTMKHGEVDTTVISLKPKVLKNKQKIEEKTEKHHN